jgi:NAD(P)-dependent dehydrogenase (short-subunit alcohol dehydrogenase family)
MASMTTHDAAAGPLGGRRALVTSSSRNLGAEIARTLAVQGARVAVTYHGSAALAHALVGEMRQATEPHVAIEGDLSRSDGVRTVVDRALDELGTVDILVNNFGPFSMVPFHRLPYEEWEHVWSGNVTSAYLATQLVVPGMRADGWGRIVNLAAGSAYLRNHSIYGLAKDAVITLTESLAIELGPEITVNAVAPGQIEESATDIGEMDPTFVARAVARTPAGRLVTRAEVARVVALLCTPVFDMLTGAVLPLDGGWRFNRF